MKRTFLALTLALALNTAVQAKTPKEVIEPYKAYRAALEANQKDEAAEFAYEAWQRAEDLIGDSKTTGDLAFNFAELSLWYIDKKITWTKVMNAYQRSVDLANLDEEDPGQVEVDRRAKYLRWSTSNISPKVKIAWRKEYSVERLNEKIVEFGLSGSTFDAEARAFVAQSAMQKKNWEEAEAESLAAIAMFESRTDNIQSVYEFAVPTYLARAYAEQDKPIEAAITYQNLMMKMERRTGHKNPISTNAYGEWLRLRDEVAAMNSTDPRALEVVNFIVPDGRASELSPLIRVPPKAPSRFLQGSKSGLVRVKFNVDINGRVVDPVIVASTHKSLHNATLESLEAWRYTPNLPDARSQDVETTIRFNIKNSFGRSLPLGEEKSRL